VVGRELVRADGHRAVRLPPDAGRRHVLGVGRDGKRAGAPEATLAGDQALPTGARHERPPRRCAGPTERDRRPGRAPGPPPDDPFQKSPAAWCAAKYPASSDAVIMGPAFRPEGSALSARAEGPGTGRVMMADPERVVRPVRTRWPERALQARCVAAACPGPAARADRADPSGR